MEREAILGTDICSEETVGNCETLMKIGNTTIIKALLIGGGVAAAGATIYVIVRNRKKRKKKTLNDVMVERLVKKGYTVVPPLEDCPGENESEEINN